MLRKFSGGASAVLFKPVKFSAILDNIELLVLQDKINTIKLNSYIQVDILKEQIYENDTQLFLTSKMHKLIIMLASNLGKLTTFEMIDEVVYDSESSSRVVMQNLVGNLKRKLNLNIKNVHSKGYILYTS
ncbi:helix-turn-helix domain-containing protein [Campylobacter geochelonis]|uniref:helix-turn-helix domain-containing protein n=1 Tax=Campylobacter geochelonis TaxID=1780362 RepID=UPI001F60B892|nr:helix-turn-helix domain-containing protein [Campylobacter geochelonis]